MHSYECKLLSARSILIYLIMFEMLNKISHSVLVELPNLKALRDASIDRTPFGNVLVAELPCLPSEVTQFSAADLLCFRTVEYRHHCYQT